MGLTPFTYLEESEYKQFKAKQESDKFAGAQASASAGTPISKAEQYQGMLPQPRFTPMDIVGNVARKGLEAAQWFGDNVDRTAAAGLLGPQMRGETTIPSPLSSAQNMRQNILQGNLGGGLMEGLKMGASTALLPFSTAESLARSQKQFVEDSGVMQPQAMPENPLQQAWSKMQETWGQTPEIGPGQKGLLEMGVSPLNLIGGGAVKAVGGKALNMADRLATTEGVAQAANLARRLVPAQSIERYGPKMGEPLQRIGPSTPEKIADAYSVGTGLKRNPEPVSDWLRRIQDKATIMAYDKLYPLKRVQGQGYALARTVPGQIARGEQMGKVMDKAIKKVGSDLTTQQDYVRFLSLMDDMDQISFSAADKFAGGLNAAQIGTEYSRLYAKYGPQELTRWKQLSHEVWDTGQQVLDELVDSGVLKAENAQALKDAHPHYMPKFRDEFDNYIPGQSSAKAAATDTTGIRTRGVEGSYRNVDDMLTNWKSNLIYGLMRAQRNRAAQAIKKGLDDMAYAEGRSGPIKVGTEPGQTKLQFFENGEAVAYDVPEDIGIAANSLLNEPGAGTIGKVFSALAAPLRYGAVTWNPTFLFKNIIRDSASAWTREGIGPAGYFTGVWNSFRQDAKFAQALDNGVLMSGLVETWRAPTVSKLATRSLGGSVVKNAADAALWLPRKMEWINTKFEQAPRIATFDKLIKQGMDPLEAAVRARDVTVDFAKSGTAIKTVNLAIPFLNANIQGSANTLRAIKDNPALFALRSSPAIAGTLAMWANNARYGDLQSKVPLDIYKNNWVVIYGSYQRTDPQFGTQEEMPLYLIIPKGQYAAIATAPFEMAIYAHNKAGNNLFNSSEDNPWLALANEMAFSLFSTVSPVDVERGTISQALPPVFSTALSLGLNKDDYTKQAIVPESLAQYSKENQFRDDTSGLSVGLGRMLGVSPMQVEYGIKDMFGGLGNLALYAGDKALEAVGYSPKAPGSALLPEKTEDEKRASIPIYNSFFKTKGTGLDQMGRETLNKVLGRQRTAFESNQTHLDLGIPLGEVPNSLIINDKETEIPWELRTHYQIDIARTKIAATEQAEKQSWFQKADAETKKKYLQDIHERAITPLRDSLKEQVQGKKATTSADAVVKQMPELASAYKYYLDYKALPAVVGISDQESRLYDSFHTTMQDYIKQNDWSQDKAYTEAKKAYKAQLGEERALKYIQAYNKVQNKPENPARKKMRDDKTIGVLLKRWFGI